MDWFVYVLAVGISLKGLVCVLKWWRARRNVGDVRFGYHYGFRTAEALEQNAFWPMFFWVLLSIATWVGVVVFIE